MSSKKTKAKAAEVTPEQEIALWMFERVAKDQYMYQEEVVFDIETRFGKDFVYINENGTRQ